MPEGPPELEQAIQDFWHDQGDGPEKGGMVTGWFLCAEGLDGDGQRWMSWAWSSDIKSWQVKGYLHEALDSQMTGSLADEVRREDG